MQSHTASLLQSMVNDGEVGVCSGMVSMPGMCQWRDDVRWEWGGGCRILANNIYNNITKLKIQHQKSIVYG